MPLRMPMRRALKRWVALAMLAAATFAQASVSVLACQMERGVLSRALQASEPHPCGEAQDGRDASELANVCVAHCTSDLQLSGATTALARAPADAPVPLSLRNRLTVTAPGRAAIGAAPPAGVPIRILLQSFQI